MKLHLGILFFAVVGVACSAQGDDTPDQGSGNVDGGADLGTVIDDPFTLANMSLLAGGLGGSGNADDIGGDARLRTPTFLAADGAGNLYFADSNQAAIHKVVLSTGAATTIAGKEFNYGNSDGVGAAASFLGPQGVAVEGGNVYIADASNNAIRKLVPATGAVTTIAGSGNNSDTGSSDGIGAAARFSNPNGLASDGAGNLYIADTNNHTIRKLVVATGAVTTIAGTAGFSDNADGVGAAAHFKYPCGLAFDGGNLYVSDFVDNTLRKLVLSSATVTTIAGSPGAAGGADGIGSAARFKSPVGLAADGAGSLYVADNGNHTLRKVGLATNAVTTVAGSVGMGGNTDDVGGAARFYQPYALAFSGGDLYITEFGNSTVRKLAPSTGAVTTPVGTAEHSGTADGVGAAARFNNPYGMVSDGAGNLYVADYLNSTIRKVVVTTGVVTTIAGNPGMAGETDGAGTAARFRGPWGLALDGAGNLYVADNYNQTIRKVVVASGEVSTLAGTARMYGSADGVGAAARFYLPQGLVYDGAGNLYVSDTTNQTIRKVVIATQEVTTLAGAVGENGSADGVGSAARFNTPDGLAVDRSGNLYVADKYNHTIRKIVLATGQVSTFVGSTGKSGGTDGVGTAARLYEPEGLAFEGPGTLYVSEGYNSLVRRVRLSDGNVTTIAGVLKRLGVKAGPLPARLNLPSGLAVLPGALVIGDKQENALLMLR